MHSTHHHVLTAETRIRTARWEDVHVISIGDEDPTGEWVYLHIKDVAAAHLIEAAARAIRESMIQPATEGDPLQLVETAA